MDLGHVRRQLFDGFSFREFLAVTLIVGLLASIAVPLFLDQRKKSHDAEAKNSLNSVAATIVTYVAKSESLPTVTVSDSAVSFGDGTVATLDPGVVLGALTGTADTWCIDDTHPHGDRAKVKGYKYSSTGDVADDKVEEGQCVTPE